MQKKVKKKPPHTHKSETGPRYRFSLKHTIQCNSKLGSSDYNLQYAERNCNNCTSGQWAEVAENK